MGGSRWSGRGAERQAGGPGSDEEQAGAVQALGKMRFRVRHAFAGLARSEVRLRRRFSGVEGTRELGGRLGCRVVQPVCARDGDVCARDEGQN